MTRPIVGTLWAISVEAWLRGVPLAPEYLPRAQRALDAIRRDRPRLPRLRNPDAVGPWVSLVQAEARSRAVLIAWAAIAAWTELGEGPSGAPWRRLAAGLEPLARALESRVGEDVAREADGLRNKAEKAAEHIR